MVNWCPGLGTVLANEEVTADGRSDRGNFPVFRKHLRQWMMRITAYSDRLVDDLEYLDWPDKVKAMQRNWIGRSRGAAGYSLLAGEYGIEVFTTRPDTLFGATYVVLAPEHELVDGSIADEWPADVDDTLDRRRHDSGGSRCGIPRVDRRQVRSGAAGEQGEDRRLHRCLRRQPGQRRAGPGVHRRLRADRLRHRRDHGRSRPRSRVTGSSRHAFGLPIREVIAGGDVSEAAYSGDGALVNSGFLDGLDVDEAKATVIARLEAERHRARGTIQYKLRDWLFARQRYWGEPFPIVYDADGNRARPAGFCSAGGTSGGRGLRAGVLRSGRRRLRALSPAGQGHRLGQRRARSGRRSADLPPRHQRHAAVGG